MGCWPNIYYFLAWFPDNQVSWDRIELPLPCEIVYFFYMKYSVNAGNISSFVKIVNFVGRAGSEYGLPMAVTKKCRRKLSAAEPPADDGFI